MAKPRSESEATYRAEMAAYLQLVRDLKDWSQAKLGLVAGYSDHTMINKALRQKHTMSFEAAMAVEQESGVPIPQALKDAAIGARQRLAVAVPPQEEIQRLTAELREAIKDKSPAERKRLLKELLGQ